MLNKDSVTVKTWVRLVKSGAKSREDVPDFLGLRELVAEVLDAEKLQP